MSKNLFEKLYCLTFSSAQDQAITIAKIVELFCHAMDFRGLTVCQAGPHGLTMVASAHRGEPGSGTASHALYDLRDPHGVKIGEIQIELRRNRGLSRKQHSLIQAFATQVEGLLNGLIKNEEDQQQQQQPQQPPPMLDELNRYKHLLTLDMMTGLYNRYYFEERLRSAEAEGIFPISIIMLDVDGLKTINDTLGHRYGDEALKDTAEFLKKTFRKEDVAARIGGDEFAVLLPGATEEVARQRCRTLMKAVENHNRINKFYTLHFSVGSATYNGGGRPLSSVMEEADQNMYEQKRQNRFVSDSARRIYGVPAAMAAGID